MRIGSIRNWVVAVGAFGLIAGLLCGQTPKTGSGPSAELIRADAAFKAGYAAVQAGKLDEALGDFRTVVKLAPQLAEGHLALAATLMQLKRPGEAVPELEKALKLKAVDSAGRDEIAENLAAAHEGVGRQLAAKGKLPEAEAEIRAAVEACPSGLGAEAASKAQLEDELGSVLAQETKWAEAEGAFRAAIGMLPAGSGGGSAGMHLHLGIALVEQKRAAEGVDELKVAVAGLTGNPAGNALAEFQLGRALALAGRDEEAVPHFAEVLKLNPAFPQANLEMGMTVQRLGRQADSIPWFEKAVEAEPRNVEALTNLGLALTESGRRAPGIPSDISLWRVIISATTQQNTH